MLPQQQHHQALHSSFTAPRHTLARRASLPENSIQIDTIQELLHGGTGTNDLHQEDSHHQSNNCDVIMFDESESSGSSNTNNEGNNSPQQQGEVSPQESQPEQQPQIQLTKQHSDDKSSNEADAEHDHLHDDVHEGNGSIIINLPLKATPAQIVLIRSKSKQPTMNKLPTNNKIPTMNKIPTLNKLPTRTNINTAPAGEEPETAERVCRVCLDSDSSEESGELENCCGCNGSLKYVHRECLFMSLENKLKHKLEGLKRSGEDCTKSGGQLFELVCELCQQTYRLGMHVDKNWCPWKDFKANLISRKETLVGSIILFLACLTVSLLLVIEIATTDSFHSQTFAQLLLFFSLFGLVIGACLLFYTLYKSAHVEHVKITKLFPDMETYNKYTQLHRDQESYIFPPGLEQHNEEE